LDDGNKKDDRGKTRKTYKILVIKHEGKKQFRRTGRR
jgi:hypothetical protein